MGKKCIPGLFCIENMTLFMIVFLVVIVLYLVYQTKSASTTKIVVMNTPLGGGENPLTNSEIPPTVNDRAYLSRRASLDIRGEAAISPPQSQQPFDPQYRQIGILTRKQNSEILPLMGRRQMTSRSKWQYYTIAAGPTGGNLQTKLPISVNGRSCTGEYGCDEISNNDTVYVEGYKDIFNATIYENSTFSYLPF